MSFVRRGTQYETLDRGILEGDREQVLDVYVAGNAYGLALAGGTPRAWQMGLVTGAAR